MDASAGFMIAITAAVVLVIILFNNKQVEDEFLTTENDEPNIVPDLIEIPSEEEIGWLKEDLRSARETEDKREEADLLNELGQIYLQLEKHEEALLYFQQAMDVEWEIGNRPGQCKNLASLAQTHTSLGQHQKAIEYYLQQLDVTRQLHDLKGEGTALKGLAISHIALEQHEQAIEPLQLAINIFQMTGSRENEIKAIDNLIKTFNLLGQYDKSMEYYQQALENAIADNDFIAEIEAEWEIGLLYEKMDDLDEAIHHMQRLVNFYKEIYHEDLKKHETYLDELKEKERWK